MYIVHVHVHVKPDFVNEFREPTIENARNSIREPGVARFDVIQKIDDPTRFILIEVYRTMGDPGRHKETVHYARWRDTVAEMMSEPRQALKFDGVFPDNEGWE